MEWPAGRKLDRAFGPVYPGKFDFTLEFEHVILDIVPKLLYLLIALFYMRLLLQRDACRRFGGVTKAQFSFLIGLIAIEVACLGVWCTPAYRSGTAVSAAVVSCITAVVLAFGVKTESRHALQSSALTGVFLMFGVLVDAVKIRSYFLRSLTALVAISIARVTFKLTIIAMLEIPRRGYITDEELRTTIGAEPLAGFWSRTFFVWLNPLFLRGARKKLTVDDLEPLGPEFSSEVLFYRLDKTWRKANKASKNALLKSCFVTFYAEFFAAFPPRLCGTGFLIAQPLYLRRVVSFVGETNPSMMVRMGLILSCALLFLGLAASQALFSHMSYRLVTMIRGALIPRVWSKTLAVPYSVAKKSSAATLMSTDIDGISMGIPDFHDCWAAILEVVAGTYVLSTILGKATFLPLLPVLAAFVATHFIGKYYAKGIKAWNSKIEERVALTTRMLLQIKSIKMAGLEDTVSETITKSRIAEVAAYKIVRIVSGAVNCVAIFTFSLSPTLAIAGGLFWTAFKGELNAVDAFTTLAVVAIVTQALNGVVRAYPYLKAIEVCFERMQNYFILEEMRARDDSQADNTHVCIDEVAQNEKMPNQYALEFKDVSLAYSFGLEAILRNVTFHVHQSWFTMLVGPVGSGKTTLLRAILGEAARLSGKIWRQRATFAYCGQITWLRNLSLRENIIGIKALDKSWFNEVVRACCLDDDLLHPANGQGEDFRAGTNGSKLSGGQKKRLALARAVYSGEDVLVLDDVLSGLDPDMAQAIFSRLFGADGLLRKLKKTVIFATNSRDFLQVADQVIILDNSGKAEIQSNLSSGTLQKELVARFNVAEQPFPKVETDKDNDSTAIFKQTLNVEDNLVSVRRGDMTLYKFFFTTVSKWKFIVWAMTVPLLVGTEQLPEVFLRIWIERDPTNEKYFGIFASIGVTGVFLVTFSSWIYFLKIIAANGIRLHSMLSDSAFGAKLSFLTSKDTGSIVNRFSQDMSILVQQMPMAFYSVFYNSTFALFTFGVVVSGAQYSAVLVPFIAFFFYMVQKYYLLTSRQIRFLDIESKTPLYTLFIETSTPNGLEHIRAFGWQSQFTKECMHALDYSQKPFYYMYAIQRWLELALDLIALFTAIIVVCIAMFFQHTTSQAALGLSMIGLINFSGTMTSLMGAWTRLETSLGAVARLKAFLFGTPQEEALQQEESLPPQWPAFGGIQLNNVNAKYHSSGPLTLENVSLAIEPSQKVVITGRSGSGKSSLILTLLGLMDYTGSIEIDGVDISSIPKRLLRSRVTTIAQDAIQLEGSVRENLVPYQGQADNAKFDDTLLLRTLERVGLSEAVARKGGIQTPLSDLGLSEGQLQFFSLARAILHNKWTGGKVVFLDEPTSNMDDATDAGIQSLVREVFADCTVLVISHRQGAAKHADVHLEVSNGRVTRREIDQAPEPSASFDEL